MFSAVEMTYLLVIIFTTYPTNVRGAIKLFSRNGADFFCWGSSPAFHCLLGSSALCETLTKDSQLPSS